MSQTSPQNLQKWITRIINSEMPVFGRTVQEIMSVSEDDVSSAIQLGQVVLKDAVMTSRILKLANSAFYNSTGHKFSTISRAIMMLGFNTVKSISLTVTLIDSLTHSVHREHLIQEMARSLHAATQAQLIAEKRGDKSPEEIFIAALLYHIGDLAFWCFSDEAGDRLHRALSHEGITAAEAQQRTLGFTFQELSQGLAHEWSLSDLLNHSLSHPSNPDPQYQTITLSHQLAKAAEQGWETEAVKSTASEIAKLIDLPPKEVMLQLHETAKKTASTSSYFGAKSIANAIPLPSDTQLEDIIEDEPLDEITLTQDPQLQLQILREMMSLGANKANFSVLMEMTLEGIHRGIGMDHALFAILTPNRQGIQAKQSLGKNKELIQKRFAFDFPKKSGKIWKRIINDQQTYWINEKKLLVLGEEIPASLESVLNTREFYVAPVFIHKKAIGLFYADRSNSKQELDQTSYDNFTLFTQQAIMLLNNILA